VLYELGRYEEALATWKRGAAMFTEWVDVEEQGHALLALGRLDEALVTVEAARRNSGVARALILHALGRTDEALTMVDDLAHRPGMRERSRKRGKPETVCAARHAAGSLLEGAFHRAAGREEDARERFERVLKPARDPREFHALLVRELGDAPGCDPDVCGRPAAVAAIAAALALGDREEARHRATALAAAIDAGSARLLTMRLWDVRGAVSLIGDTDELATHAAEAVERCSSEPLLRL
jgi:tetratricopeptide (TPR) repeat protein